MKIYVNVFEQVKFETDFDALSLVKKIVKSVLVSENIDVDVSVNVSVVSKAKIKKLNMENRNIDSETDVLSFPNICWRKPSHINDFIDKDVVDVSIVDMSNNSIFLGDIVVCKDKIIAQAKMYGHSIKREFAFLITHSMFHLLGYDHMKKNDEKIMFEKQEKILDILKIYR